MMLLMSQALPHPASCPQSDNYSAGYVQIERRGTRGPTISGWNAPGFFASTIFLIRIGQRRFTVADYTTALLTAVMNLGGNSGPTISVR
jgi:hypothetical protein